MKIQSWNIVLLLGLAAYVIIRGVFEQRVKTNVAIVRRSGHRDGLLILLMAIGGLVLPIVYAFTPLLAFADYQLPAFVPWIGLTSMLAALWLFWRSHADLGTNWSRTVEIREGHRLVTHGVYQLIRHPMYAANWLFSLAQGLMLHNWLAGWSAFAAFAVMYFVRIGKEEGMMSEFFGLEYESYMRRTGRVFPRIKVKADS